jgi:hypothetical protein
MQSCISQDEVWLDGETRFASQFVVLSLVAPGLMVPKHRDDSI